MGVIMERRVSKKKAAIYGGIADDARHTENKNMSVMIV